MPRGRPGLTPKIPKDPVIQTGKKPNPSHFSADNPRPGPGRPKGSRNKFSGDLKRLILDAAANVIPNGDALDYFIQQARQANPSPFMSLIGKCITQSSEAKVTGDVSFYFGQPVPNNSQPEDLTGEDD